MRNINNRILKWVKDSVLLAEVIKDNQLTKLIDDVFCDNPEKRTVTSLKLYDLLWGIHPELGPCPDVKRLSHFEYDGIFYTNYRDHVSHAIKTFFLGLYLYENNKSIKENVDSWLIYRGVSDIKNSFILTWTMTSLFHDIGYFFENEKIEHDNDLRKGLLDSINERMALPLSSTKFFSADISPKKESFLINKNKIFTPKIMSISDLEDDEQFQILFDYSKKSGLSYAGSIKNGIEQYYRYAKSHSPNPQRSSYSDHGIVSALIMLKTWLAYDDYLSTIASSDYRAFNEDNAFITKLRDVRGKLTNTKLLVTEAAGAIALHNILNYWKEEEILACGIDFGKFLIKLEGDNRIPFAFLLRLTDELQCWDRPKYSMPSEDDISLTCNDIDICAKNSDICIWFKDDERFATPETEKNSRYHKFIGELSKYLDIKTLTFSFHAEDEENVKADSVKQDSESHQSNAPSSDAETEYLNYIKEKYNKIAKIYSELSAVELGGVFENIFKPEAQDFVDMTFKVNHMLSHSFERLQNPIQVEGFDEIFEYFSKYKRVALTGDPGSGKSTTLGFAAHKFATMCLDKTINLIPILIDLGGMNGEPVEAYLIEHIDERVRNFINTDRLVLLLDGFNEVSPQDAQNLTSWINNKPDQCLIITCRRADYIERQLSLRRIDIEPLDLMQIWEMMGKYLNDKHRDKLFWALAGSEAERAWLYFTKRYTGSDPFRSFWFGDIGLVRPSESEKTIISGLQKSLKNQGKMPGMLPLLSNPFLLYAAMTLYEKNHAAPQSRREVLTGFANAMLDKAGISYNLLHKGMDHIWTDLNIESSSLTNDPGNWIAYCAFRMFERGGGTAVPLLWLRDELMTQFKNESVKGFIEKLIAGNILGYGPNEQLVKFRYQVMQEFFAAVHLYVTRDYSNKLPVIFEKEKWWEPSTWDETIRITAELLNDATALIQSLYGHKPDLAYTCIREGVYCREEVLRELLDPSEFETPASPRARAAWGESLVVDNKVDSRSGVGIKNGFPEFDWIFVEHGQVNVGIDDRDGAVMGVAGNTINVELDNDFYISKFPTTHLQFEAFLRDGYEDRENWSDLGWRWKGIRQYPELWLNPKYSLNNAPVVGVSWFEAMAFCRWASRKLAPEGWLVDLPLEAEWERAARFPDGRIYPWGNDYLQGHANIDESAEGAVCGPFSLGKPTSVGIYSKGLSTLGIADMCGNVWEWCKNRWDVRYEWPEVTASEKVDHRVIKGGSWYNSIRFARLGIHDCLDADLGVNDIGFRVIKKKICENSQNLQMTRNPISHTVRKILVLGTTDSGRTEFVRSIGDFPLQEVSKKDFSTGVQIQMDYGRRFHNDYMYYFYAPLVADDTNLSRFINEMQGVIFILSGCKEHSQFNWESLFSISELCKSHGIPLLVGVSGSDLDGFSLSRSHIEVLQRCGVAVSFFCAVERLSCTNLLDVLFK